jgi:D-alanyl-D-alanine carboxypeptidase/D-alanyl-D-alanine-endopeptidase (penicillin-binding protein 4)
MSVAPGASSLTLLGSTFSPTLDRIVFETNHASNNLYAESLLRSLGKELCSSACYDSSYVALKDVLEGLAVDFTVGARVKDGSGLSRQNYVSADFFCRFLEGMMSSPHFEAYAASLPSPGGNGTLSYNMKSYPASVRERILVKSGSMNGVRCYSGYIIPTDGCKDDCIIFSILVNNCTAPTWKLRPLLDKIMGTLAGLN